MHTHMHTHTLAASVLHACGRFGAAWMSESEMSGNRCSNERQIYAWRCNQFLTEHCTLLSRYKKAVNFNCQDERTVLNKWGNKSTALLLFFVLPKWRKTKTKIRFWLIEGTIQTKLTTATTHSICCPEQLRKLFIFWGHELEPHKIKWKHFNKSNGQRETTNRAIKWNQIKIPNVSERFWVFLVQRRQRRQQRPLLAFSCALWIK